jgi:hypothetical protein
MVEVDNDFESSASFFRDRQAGPINDYEAAISLFAADFVAVST